MEDFCRKRDNLNQIMRTSMLIMIMVMTIHMQCTSATLHRVGGKSGWAQNVNYTEWASQERFYRGDWLIFYFDKRIYNVLEVNKTNYEKCWDQDFITNITKGGRDVFELKEARPYYFLSGGGFCWGGMKVAITVQEVPTPPPPSPAPAASKSDSLPGSSSITMLFAFSIALVWALNYI